MGGNPMSRKRKLLSEGVGSNFDSPEHKQKRRVLMSRPEFFDDPQWPSWKDTILFKELHFEKTLMFESTLVMKRPKSYDMWSNDFFWQQTSERISIIVKKHHLVDDLTMPVDNFAVKKRARKYRSSYKYQPHIFEFLEKEHPELFKLAEAVVKPPMERFVVPHSMFSRTRSKSNTSKSNTSGRKRISISQMPSDDGNSAELGEHFQLALDALRDGGDITMDEWYTTIIAMDGNALKLAGFCIMTTEDKIYFVRRLCKDKNQSFRFEEENMRQEDHHEHGRG